MFTYSHTLLLMIPVPFDYSSENNFLNLCVLCLIHFRDTGDIVLKICNLMPQDTGIYTCVAVNDHGTASSSASIKVQGEKTQREIKMGVHLSTCCN